MSVLDTFASELFGMPGGGSSNLDAFVRRVAWAHRTLLVRAAIDANCSETNAGPLLAAIEALLRRNPCRDIRDRFLFDPTFVEGLHGAAHDSPSLGEWHRQIADPSVARVWTVPTAERASHLGNSLLALLLRDDPHWQGTVRLQTDLYGRLRFPLCDWSIALWSKRDGADAVLSQQAVAGTLTRNDFRLSLLASPDDDLLVIPRREWWQMLVENAEQIAARGIVWPEGDVGLRFQRATEIPEWRVRYDPVSMHHFDRHAGLTGGLVTTVLGAIAVHSPAIAAEFGGLISAVRGWELPTGDYGTLQSFSDPTLPRVMGINVPYSDDDEPQACPYCFTWFGHELGHTKSYLIETILHVLGHSLTSRHGEYTETLSRYGRALPVRTLLQIPYTHLYEWILMMDFIDGDFSALPWAPACDDPISYTDDLRAEIDEGFDCIDREAPLSTTGQVVMARLHAMRAEVETRWQRDCMKVAMTPNERRAESTSQPLRQSRRVRNSFP